MRAVVTTSGESQVLPTSAASKSPKPEELVVKTLSDDLKKTTRCRCAGKADQGMEGKTRRTGLG